MVANESYVPPRAIFKASTDTVGPTMNEVPVSTIAYNDELMMVSPT